MSVKLQNGTKVVIVGFYRHDGTEYVMCFPENLRWDLRLFEYTQLRADNGLQELSESIKNAGELKVKH